jgi:methylmalonyl-CoA mutase N-terminal domain/subunit
VLRATAARSIRILSEEVDAIEAAVRAEIPEAKPIDIEIDHIEQAGATSK